MFGALWRNCSSSHFASDVEHAVRGYPATAVKSLLPCTCSGEETPMTSGSQA